jgi:predicted nucleic acid-binding protein
MANRRPSGTSPTTPASVPSRHRSCSSEVYQGEVYRSDGTDLDAVDRALGWLTVVDGADRFARSAAELQAELRRRGSPLAARDAYVAGTAPAVDEPLVVSDSDFETDALRETVDLTVLDT